MELYKSCTYDIHFDVSVDLRKLEASLKSPYYAQAGCMVCFIKTHFIIRYVRDIGNGVARRPTLQTCMGI